MENKIIILLVISIVHLKLAAQNIGINATGATPNPSAMLDVSSTSKGLLMPRMTTLQRNAIATPAEGLKVYDTDTKTFWFYNGTGWIQSATGSPTNFWGDNGGNIFNSNGGNVGIGNTNPANNKLEIGTATGFLHNDLAIGNGVAGMSFLQTNTASIWYTSKDFALMPASGTGNLGIGTTAPVSKLTLQTDDNTDGFTHISNGGIVVTERVGGVSGSIGTSSNHTFRLVAGPGDAKMHLYTDGSVVVGSNSIPPAGKFTVEATTAQYGITQTDGTVTLGAIVGNGAGFFGTKSDHPLNFFTANGTPRMSILTNGNVGIGSVTPTNKLQIGSVGASGFATNDLAIGNGSNAMAIFQTNASTLIGATTDIVIMPRNNGHGRVGINTTTPRAPLDVVDNVVFSSAVGYSYLNSSSEVNGIGGCNFCFPVVSIYASQAVLASEFDAYSDARIKNILDVSNSAKDLETINALHITDYTMKDKVKYGNKPFKKVIAQEVEKVYPQVISKHSDFIPNVYQPSAKIEKVATGYLISFAGKHNISPAAKKLRVLLSETKGMEEVDIVSLPSDRQVIINATDIQTAKVFVYGEEVSDFRTVDYEGLTTLNISASQELSKLIKKQQLVIEQLQKRLSVLEARNKSGGLAIN
jgi:hypothetical protein